MDGPVVSYLFRAVVGVSFALSAWFKLTHPTEFKLVYRLAAPAPFAKFNRLALALVPALELACFALLIVPRLAPKLASASALILLTMFTVSLVRITDLRAGCGCWGVGSSRRADRRWLLIRNGILITLSVVSLVLPVSPASIRESVFLLAVGSLFAFVIMELPTIGASTWTPEGRQHA